MSEDDPTPPIRNFQRLVTTGHRGAILTTGGNATPYPEWSEGEAASGGIIAFNGDVFVATTVVGASEAAGQPILHGSQDSTIEASATLLVEGIITALPSGHVHVPSPSDDDDATPKAYVDDLVNSIVVGSGGITMGYADLRYINASGDTMEGQLVQPLSPVASGDLANKAYVDSQGSDANYLHTQVIASDTWTVVHSLLKYPTATIIDASDEVVIADIHHTSTSQLEVLFSTPQTGKVSLN